MNLETFNTPQAVSEFITTNAITAADCKVRYVDGVWYLFWWGAGGGT